MIYKYANIQEADVNAGVVHWFLRKVFKEPQGVTMSEKEISIEYSTPLADSEKAQLDSYMATPITWKFNDQTVSLDLSKLKTIVDSLLSSPSLQIILDAAKITIRLDEPLTAAQKTALLNALKDVKLADII